MKLLRLPLRLIFLLFGHLYAKYECECCDFEVKACYWCGREE